ncbi:MAG: hypothetical protein PVH61_12350 [Candidatus Aminicenantes bacterium]|jgi:hypothetical protein
MKQKSLIPGDDLIRVRVCTVSDMIKKVVAPPTHSRFAGKIKFRQESGKKDGFEV